MPLTESFVISASNARFFPLTLLEWASNARFFPLTLSAALSILPLTQSFVIFPWDFPPSTLFWSASNDIASKPISTLTLTASIALSTLRQSFMLIFLTNWPFVNFPFPLSLRIEVSNMSVSIIALKFGFSIISSVTESEIEIWEMSKILGSIFSILLSTILSLVFTNWSLFPQDVLDFLSTIVSLFLDFL